MDLRGNIHVLLLLVLACVVLQCHGLEFYRRNPGAITAQSRAIILQGMVSLIQSIHREKDYYVGLSYQGLATLKDGRDVQMTITCSNLQEPWYAQLRICSIFPSWGVMLPGLSLQYNFMRVYQFLYADAGDYGVTEVTQGRYTLSYIVINPTENPDMFEMAAATCSNCSTSASKNTTSSNIETTELVGESLHVNYTAVDWEAAELANVSLQADYEPDCWVYKCCIRSGPHDLPLSRLETGGVLKSPTGRYYLTMQADCNLVLYMGETTPVWASQTQNKGRGCILRMQMDGNLVIYDSAFNVVWSYNKFCRRSCWLPYALCVEDSGQAAVCNTVDQTCIWSSLA